MKRLLTLENLFRKEALRHQSERFLGEPRTTAFRVRSALVVSSLLFLLTAAAVALLNVPYSRTVRLNCALVSSSADLKAGARAALPKVQVSCPVAKHYGPAVLTALLEGRSSMSTHIADGHMRTARGTPLNLASQSESLELLLVTDRLVAPSSAGQQTMTISVDMGRSKTFGILFDR